MPGLALGISPTFAAKAPAVVHPLLTDLLAYWSLDETTGNRADSSGNGLTLTPAGSVTYDTGLQGNAAKFANASLDQLKIDPCPEALNIGGAASFTVMLWYKIFSVATGYEYRRLLDHSDTTVAGGKWRHRGISAIVNNTGPEVVTRGATGELNEPYSSTGSNWLHGGIITLNAWHCLLFEHNAATHYYTQYSDNTLITGLTPPQPCPAPDGIYKPADGLPFILGATDLASNNTLDGLIDEVAIWSRVLTATERTWLYNAGSARTYAAVAAYTG